MAGWCLGANHKTSPLLVIVGPTASGKTALAIELATKFDGEIICADSRTVYKHLDIGTAKPTAGERATVPHHLLDVVEPDEPFTVADFKQRATKVVEDISGKGRLPIMVGGSGLYVDAVLFDYSFSPEVSERDPINARHVHPESTHTKQPIRGNTVVIGLDVPRDELKQRIAQRVDTMIADGFIEEVEELKGRYPGFKALDAPGYKAFADYIDGSISLEEAKELFVRNDYQLARRQQTWFRRNKSIQWISDPRQAVDIVTTFLSKKQ